MWLQNLKILIRYLSAASAVSNTVQAIAMNSSLKTISCLTKTCTSPLPALVTTKAKPHAKKNSMKLGFLDLSWSNDLKNKF